MKLHIRPTTLAFAKQFVKDNHRHNKPPIGHKFSVGIYAEDVCVGVAIASRPIARMLDDGLTLEVTRTCTNGTKNANSMLYGAIAKAAAAMGYKKCITYTQHTESGSSLRGAGWTPVADLQPRPGWDCPSRGRGDIGTSFVRRTRWEKKLTY